MVRGTYSSCSSSDSFGDEDEDITLVELNKKKNRDHWRIYDNTHEDEDSDASFPSVQTEGVS